MMAGVCALAVCANAEDAGTITKKTAERYRNLAGYRLEGSYEVFQGNSRGSGELAGAKFVVEGDGGTKKLHIEYKGPQVSMSLISNGETTWTYLASDKTYTKVDAVESSGGEEEEGAAENDNLLTTIYQMVVTRYASMDSGSLHSELEGEQEVKTTDGKQRCWVMVTQLPNQVQKSWISEETYLVLRSEITGPGRTKLTSSLKRFNLEKQDEADFTFVPSGKVKLVDELSVFRSSASFIGRPAADFALKDLDGQQVQLSELHGKVVVLDFWATWCPPCRRELPAINKLAEEERGKDVVVLGINNEGKGTVKNFNKKYQYNFTTLEDSGGKVQRNYRASSIPNVFIIGKDGVILRHFVGTREEQELRAAILQAQQR